MNKIQYGRKNKAIVMASNHSPTKKSVMDRFWKASKFEKRKTNRVKYMANRTIPSRLNNAITYSGTKSRILF
ncbi:hypothetical protein OAU25_03165, partial [Crocinitomicaceae bacterium]|nr:hypothetical protein [Crocinitomicaceae bacterium]